MFGIYALTSIDLSSFGSWELNIVLIFWCLCHAWARCSDTIDFSNAENQFLSIMITIIALQILQYATLFFLFVSFSFHFENCFE